MLIIARITKDAVVNQLKDQREVINFTVAVNDYYRAKGSDQPTKVTSFINCSYWINPTIAGRLKKGALVELSGRISTNAYTNAEGQAKASLNFHVNSVKIHSTASSTVLTNSGSPNRVENTSTVAEALEDLPF